jgi:hypothetical protein
MRRIFVGVAVALIIAAVIYSPSWLNLIVHDHSYCLDEFPSFTCISPDMRELFGLEPHIIP